MDIFINIFAYFVCTFNKFKNEMKFCNFILYNYTRIISFFVLFITSESGDYPRRKPSKVNPAKLLRLSPEMEQHVYGADSNRYIKEVRHNYTPTCKVQGI